ncbi:hypothetical protein [Bradyrhizobium sp. STM 3566]|uniref:hypothetical protein n=1 Tax=Bradyrhizobium sp. STM 3566 TaxID=578928 RepID=UPI00388EB86F
MPWTRAAAGTVPRNESYIGNLIFNRKSQKLRQAASKIRLNKGSEARAASNPSLIARSSSALR